MNDATEAIAAGRARRARDRKVARAVLGVSLVVYLVVVAVGADDAGALAVAGTGALSLGVEAWRTRGREGVERQALQRRIAFALLVVASWAVGVHVARMVDADVPVRSSYYLYILGLGLMIGGVVFDGTRSNRRDDEDA